jgi:hypothetical protein
MILVKPVQLPDLPELLSRNKGRTARIDSRNFISYASVDRSLLLSIEVISM